MTFLKNYQKKNYNRSSQINLMNLIKGNFQNLTKTIITIIKIALEIVEIVLIIHQDQTLTHQEENHNIYENTTFYFLLLISFDLLSQNHVDALRYSYLEPLEQQDFHHSADHLVD